MKFHYPNQQLISISSQNTWKSEYTKSTNYTRRIDLGYINILRRRNKPNRPCYDGNYDQHILERATRLVGCMYHVINTTETIPYCKRADQIDAFDLELAKQTRTNPCTSLRSAYDWYGEIDELQHYHGEPLLELKINYPDDFYKEVIYTREYSFESLIGNIGGYIGNLCCRFQIPYA